MRDHPDYLEQWIEQVCEYLLKYLPDEYPRGILSFIRDLEVHGFVRGLFDQFKTTGLDFDQPTFIKDVIRFVNGEVRSSSVLALQEILSRSIVQGSDPASRYAERFFVKARLVPSESQTSLCHHFLAGLKSELRGLCFLDREGCEWSSLHSLVQYVYSEELRINARRPVYPAPPVNAMPHVHPVTPSWRSSPMQTYRQVPFKKQRRDNPATVAVIDRPSSQARPSNQAGPSRLGPPESCPLFGLNTSRRSIADGGKNLSSAEKAVLSSYGLCWFCKKSSGHSALECPLKRA